MSGDKNAPKNAHNKPIIQQVPRTKTDSTEPQFKTSDFDKALASKGYNALVEKAIRCPCYDIATGASQSNCNNCGGTQWVFVDKRSTTLLVSSINRQTKWQNWTEEDRGTITISARGDDRLAFMDRITVLDVTSIYSERITCNLYNGKLHGVTVYSPLAVTEAYLFRGPDRPLELLTPAVDFTIEDNQIILNNKFNNANVNKGVFAISVRYTHSPTYHIIDIPREVHISKERADCETELDLEKMPINAIGRKTHFVLDAPDMKGNSLFDNSDVDSNALSGDSFSPTSLISAILRSSASQIVDALEFEGNTNKNDEIKNSL